ncbi:MAG: hypothetical protein LBG43_00500 [Treponema sp.]|nr:hypothetical protein [Treponema sp.]
MGCPVKLEETGFPLVPGEYDSYRYLVSQGGAGLCQAQPPQPSFVFYRFEDAVDGAGADGGQEVLHFRGKGIFGGEEVQYSAEHGCQELSA